MGFSSPSILTSNSLYAYVCGRGQKDDCVSALRVVDRGCQRLCSCSWNAVHVERDLPGQLRPPPPSAYREGGERIGAVGLDLEGALLRFFYYIHCLALDWHFLAGSRNPRQPSEPHHPSELRRFVPEGALLAKPRNPR